MGIRACLLAILVDAVEFSLSTVSQVARVRTEGKASHEYRRWNQNLPPVVCQLRSATCHLSLMV
jgi:hypothetical protein